VWSFISTPIYTLFARRLGSESTLPPCHSDNEVPKTPTKSNYWTLPTPLPLNRFV